MKVSDMKLIFLFGIIVTGGGCAAVQNLTMDDLKNNENFHKEGVVAKTISEISADFYAFEQKCRPLMSRFEVNPREPSEARVVSTTPGWTQMNPVMLLEFKQDAAQRVTRVRSYAYYPGGRRDADFYMSVVSDPQNCQL